MSTAERLRQWLGLAADAVASQRERLDAINVFPIADSDTGTNMYLTLLEGNRAVAQVSADATHHEVVTAFARGALMGARGNSGVIVSQHLGAFLESLDTAGGLDAATSDVIATALETAADAAYEAVGEPVEGTILSVARAAARGARAAAENGSDAAIAVVAAVAGARSELAYTNKVLEVAREAGVVDAGAAGLVLVLEMLAETVGDAGALAEVDVVDWQVGDRDLETTPAQESAALHADDDVGGAYEVMFVAARPTVVATEPGAEDVPIKDALANVGTAVAVTGGVGLWQAHVHTDLPELVADLATRADATQVVVRDIAATVAVDRAETGVVALTSCPGLAPALTSSGAAVLVAPDPDKVGPLDLERVLQDASDTRVVAVAGTSALLAALRGVPESDELPDIEILPTASEAAALAAVTAAALTSPGHDPAPGIRDAAARTRTTRSTADAAAEDLARLVRDDTEVALVILGRSISAAVGDEAARKLASSHPDVDVQVFKGRQTTPAVILGAEAGA